MPECDTPPDATSRVTTGEAAEALFAMGGAATTCSNSGARTASAAAASTTERVESPLVALPPVQLREPILYPATITDFGTDRMLHKSQDAQEAYQIWPHTRLPLGNRRGFVYYGTVLRKDQTGVFCESSTTVAIKQLKRSKFDSRLESKFVVKKGKTLTENPYREIALMQQYGDNKHIMECHEALEDRRYLYIITLRAPAGDLFNQIDWRGQMRWELGGGYQPRHDIPLVAKQLLKSLQYMQQCGLVHRDLKPENVLFLSNHCPVIDLAQALRIPTVDNTLQLLSPRVASGTPGYIAPEVYSNQPFNHKADMWAFGSILFNLLTGFRFCEQPLPRNEIFEFFIVNQGFVRESQCHEKLQELNKTGGAHSELGIYIQAVQMLTTVERKLLQRILKEKPQDRPDAEELLGDDFFAAV